jgi:glycosyltransferase involved in cell wall biosynthesis
MAKVSVVITTHNRKALAQQAIDSVLNQTFSDYEIIVVDDGSMDGTGAALKARYGDRIRYSWQEPQGPSASRNRGLAEANGTFIAFLDDDDVYLPQMLEVATALLESMPEVGLVGVQGYSLTECGQLIPELARRRTQSGDIEPEELLFHWPILTSNMVTRRAVLTQIGGYDPNISHSEDCDLYARILARWRIYFLAEPLMAFRQGDYSRLTGQLLDPEKAMWRFTQHKRLFSKLEHSPLFQDLMPRAWAAEKARLGFNQMANGNCELAESLLSESFQLDTSDWFYREVVRKFFLPVMEALDEERGVEEAVVFARRVFAVGENSRAFQQGWRRILLGEFHETRFFRKAYRGDWPAMRYSYLRAMKNAPRNLGNRGMHAYVLRSFMSSVCRDQNALSQT